MEVVLKPTIRTNMHICVPVLIPCPIPGLIWLLSSYINSAKGVILVYTQCVGDSLVYTQRVGGYIQGNTCGLGISQEKSRINPSMRQLMVERGIPNGKVAPSLQHLMADKSQGLL